MPITIWQAILNLAVALLCGALIGTERQVRHRLAGLRTNALVAVGSAGFVIYSQLYPNEVAQTRVAAQVVSGIGFLGAGLMFRHGFQVHGLNTAATLWCSAAVGVLAGAGAVPFAAALTGVIFFINFGLRPVVRLIKRRSGTGEIPEQRVFLSCAAADEADVRRLALVGFAAAEIGVQGLLRQETDGRVLLEFPIDIGDCDPADLGHVIATLLADTRILGAEMRVPAPQNG